MGTDISIAHSAATTINRATTERGEKPPTSVFKNAKQIDAFAKPVRASFPTLANLLTRFQTRFNDLSA
ncbi:hypothetical protein A3843_11885 [Pseudovibrio exalbescens]|uniref:Uncharacterized protein n=1 Tax=Pseudovibrio exalbescens TaxID=197461 RepID=A0A1U7JGI4_9HYPH|nr:hypothetical protein A3843_11885 [Pseudovibrio exalbescens]